MRFSLPSLRAARAALLRLSVAAAIATAAHSPSSAQDFPYPILPVYVPTDGSGNAQYPPAWPYELTSHPGTMLIRDGLPAGSAITGRLHIYDMAIATETAGGPLGGEITDIVCRVGFEMRGVGAFAAYSRSINLPAIGRIYSALPAPGSPQVFALDMGVLQGQILGDPDFDLLRITGGTDFGMPSAGNARATLDGTGEWRMDSFFDITYRVDFVGAPGGPFAGLSGSTVYTHRQRSGPHDSDACVVTDNGLGTADWPPPTPQAHRSRTEGVIALEGPIPTHGMVADMNWFTVPGSVVVAPGGSLGGEVVQTQKTLTLEIRGEGTLGLYSKAITVPVNASFDVAPAMYLNPHQGRASELQTLFGQISGDPDFALLRVISGTSFGLPSYGHTSLTHDVGGEWRVDSFFDITYRVDFVGEITGPLAGLSGSFVGTIRCQMGEMREGNCPAPDNGFGTIDFPPMCAPGYQSVRQAPGCIAGMPVNSPLLIDVEMAPLSIVASGPGGSLGGEAQAWNANWRFHVVGTGAYAGYERYLNAVGPAETHTAPHAVGVTPQHFETLVHQAQGQVIGDPDFDLLRISAGNGFGLPSPGHTTLVQSGPQWLVDSFFDITYRVDFVGAIGGALAGLSGSTTARRNFVTGKQMTVSAPSATPPSALRLGPATPNPARQGSTLALELPRAAHVRATVHDVAGRFVRTLCDGDRGVGSYALRWDGRDASGAAARPGLYLVRVSTGERTLTGRVIVTR